MSRATKIHEADYSWKLIGLTTLCIRFVQGWIFWGGGSRRFIYDPYKLDPYSAQWMANKLQSAMPGALLGIEHIISYLLQHFFLLYSSIILFSLIELISGLALILGFFTRFAALMTVFISITLMIIFGWQGTTCMDEWTMAVATLAMGLTLTMSGSPVYSIDNLWLRRFPKYREKKWFNILASGSWPNWALKEVAIVFLIFTMLFTLSTYSYYRGAVISRYHAGPVSAYQYHLQLSQGTLLQNGNVSFNLYVNAGPDAAPTYIIRIELKNQNGQLIEKWDRKKLSQLSQTQVKNKYRYNQIRVGLYGLIAPVSAEAKITLPAAREVNLQPHEQYQLQVYLIDGQRFDLNL